MAPKPFTIISALALSAALLVGGPAFAKSSVDNRCLAPGASAHAARERGEARPPCARAATARKGRARGERINPGNHPVRRAEEVKPSESEKTPALPDSRGYAQGAGS